MMLWIPFHGSELSPWTERLVIGWHSIMYMFVGIKTTVWTSPCVNHQSRIAQNKMKITLPVWLCLPQEQVLSAVPLPSSWLTQFLCSTSLPSLPQISEIQTKRNDQNAESPSELVVQGYQSTASVIIRVFPNLSCVIPKLRGGCS